MTVGGDAALDVTLARTIAASPSAIWDAWMDPERLKRWWAPEPFETVDCLIEPRVGGLFTTVMRGPEGEEITRRGVFLELVENERIIFTDALVDGFRPSGEVASFTGVFTMEAADGGTRVVARALHASAEARARHEENGFLSAWNRCFDQLEAVVAGG